jgi:fatty-acid desaturase
MNHIKPWMVYLNVCLNFLCYAGLLAGIYYGTALDYFYIFLVYIFISINEQAFFHRMLTHRSWNAPTWIKVIGLHISTLSLLAPAYIWVAVHRQHHQYTDTEKDPHSPLYHSNMKIQFLSSLIPFDIRFAADLIKNKIVVFYTVCYFQIIFVSWAVLIYLIGLDKFFTIWLAGTALAIITANGINTWHHSKIYWPGQYRNTQRHSDTSKNDLLTGFLIFDGWHNNHHANPKSYYYGKKWWELDICGIYIWLIATVTGYKSSLRK